MAEDFFYVVYVVYFYCFVFGSVVVEYWSGFVFVDFNVVVDDVFIGIVFVARGFVLF